MTAIAAAIFWIAIIIIGYTYIGYPLLMIILVSIKRVFFRAQRVPASTPPAVTLIVCAFNEEQVIEMKIKNTKELDYPPALLNVIFITDGSTDNTPDLISRHPEFRLLHEDKRRGKLAAMNRAIQHAHTDYVVFSDANGMLNKDCLTRLMMHYHHQHVGGVSGEKKIIVKSSASAEKGEGLYWKYESLLKKVDSDLNTVVGAAGELFSIRRSLYTMLPEHIIIEDFVQSLLLCQKGYVVRYEPEAYSAEAASHDIATEMERKIRISAGGFQAMVYLRSLLNVFRHPVLTFQYVSHRVLRWTIAPLALPVALVTSGITYAGSGHFFHGMATAVQLVFYFMAGLGWYYARDNRKHPLFYIPFYFLFMNFCVFAGFFRYISNKQETTWKKADRS